MQTIVTTPASRIPSKALAPDELRRLAPSVFAETARPGVSSRYTFVSTAQVVDLLDAEGWSPVRAHQQRVRLETRQGFQMHELRFARRSDLDRETFAVGDMRPELILQNAHDGTRAYRIDAGLYRLVCRNGLTVADAQFAHVAIRHVDVSAERFVAAARAVAEGTPRVFEVVSRWRSVQMSETVRQEFARRAIALRWDMADTATRLVTPQRLLKPVRYDDHATDLWTTFNVVQEHLCRGGICYSGNVPAAAGAIFPTHFVRNTTRPVVSLTEGQKLNKVLWALAEEFSRN